jgi:hypothetical protein
LRRRNLPGQERGGGAFQGCLPILPGLSDYRQGLQDRNIVPYRPEDLQYPSGFPCGKLKGSLIGFHLTNRLIGAYRIPFLYLPIYDNTGFHRITLTG